MRLHSTRWLRAIALVVGLWIVWGGLVVLGTLEGWGHSPLAPRGDFRAFADTLGARLAEECSGNAVMLLVVEGRIERELTCSLGEAVDRDSVFQLASLSKWITAWGVMTLVEEGRLELDAPVSRSLTRWRLPDGPFDTEGVTVRRLLSHTAGLTDGLGYDGFGPGERVQSLEASLTHATDTMPRASGVVRVGAEPGSRWQYSGGGYTLLQLLVEEVTGDSFASYMQRAVLDPLGMQHSTFDADRAQDLPLAPLYDDARNTMAYRRFTALAAASLFASASDLARFLQAHRPGPEGEPIGRGVLAPATVREMTRPQASRWGRDIWGLGTILYVRSGVTADGEDAFVIGHEGHNTPAINASARLDPVSGDGIIVLQSGRPTLATELASEWVYWATGRPDIFMLLDDLEPAAWIFAAGAMAIMVVAIGVARTHGPIPSPDRVRSGAPTGGSPR